MYDGYGHKMLGRTWRNVAGDLTSMYKCPGQRLTLYIMSVFFQVFSSSFFLLLLLVSVAVYATL